MISKRQTINFKPSIGLLVVCCLLAWEGADSVLPAQITRGRDLGAPSLSEMVLRLQYRHQQDTPIFDLLRNSGRDIFSKLDDDQRKFAERFAEDLINKQGLESAEVQELLNRMKVDPSVREALDETLKEQRTGAGGSSASNVNVDRLRRRLEKLRKDRTSFENLSRPANPDWLPRVSASGASPNAPSSLKDPFGNPTSPEQPFSSELAERADLANSDSQPLPNNRKLAENQSTTANSSRIPRPQNGSAVDRRLNDVDQSLSGSERSNSDLLRSGQGLLDRELVDQASAKQNLDSNRSFDQLGILNRQQQEAIERIQENLPHDSKVGQSTSANLEQLKRSKSPIELIGKLQKLAADVDDDESQREVLRSATKQLTESDRQAIKSFFEVYSPELAKSMKSELAASRATEPRRSEPRSGGEILPDGQADTPEDWVQQEFLRKAISYYNDEDSGFEKPKGYDRILNDKTRSQQASTKMNLKAAKELWKNSGDIFSDSTASNDKSKKLEFGQKMDQILMDAINKVSDDETGDKDSSFWKKSLGGVMASALDHAKTVAKKRIDKKTALANPNAANGLGNNSAIQRNPKSSSEWTDDSQLDDLLASSNQSPEHNSTVPPSVSDSDGAFGSLIPGRENWQLLLLVLGGIGLAVLAIVLVWSQLQSDDPKVARQKQLQEKLKSGPTATPGDFVEAVDLFLLTKFGTVASWWNSHFAAQRLEIVKPGWQEKIRSLFQVYRKSRYQVPGDTSVSVQQQQLVVTTLQELSGHPDEDFADAGKPGASFEESPPPATGQQLAPVEGYKNDGTVS